MNVVYNMDNMEGMKQKEIAEEMGLHISTVSRFLQPGYKPYKSKAKYFSEIKRDKEWFLEI